MTTTPRRTATLPRKTLVAAVAAVTVLGGLHLWLNTNVLGDSALCGGLVTAEAAESVLTGAGRISDRPGPRSGADDGKTQFDCVIERGAAALPGSETQTLHLQGTSERGDFAFTGSRFPDASTVTFFKGGGAGPGRAWVLLPAACTDRQAGLVEAYAPEDADPAKVVELLTDTANRVSDRTGCALPTPPAASDRVAPVMPRQQAISTGVCGLPGFIVPEARVQSVQVSGISWVCGTATAEGETADYATFSVTQDPAVIEGIRKSEGFTGQGFDATHTVSDCSGKATYFAMEPGPRYTESIGTGAPAPKDLFNAFTEKVGAKFGCPTP
ncbi:hypothetical protein PUR57_05530 [Streptomyces sp. JV176]|uniref:hypothetical protein n=1 Tax=Streptomyces sp. JV176 TaxID=858630 RepID=UPI002E76C256|nr:hypothetical protein [Streptomyces sp. JV176]MEE1798142.1 hypothetical protein [Streptomyces sp. JV176]